MNTYPPFNSLELPRGGVLETVASDRIGAVRYHASRWDAILEPNSEVGLLEPEQPMTVLGRSDFMLVVRPLEAAPFICQFNGWKRHPKAASAYVQFGSSPCQRGMVIEKVVPDRIGTAKYRGYYWDTVPDDDSKDFVPGQTVIVLGRVSFTLIVTSDQVPLYSSQT